MSGGIFISYRRDDSAGSTGRLYDSLVSAGIAAEALFIDVDNIPIGTDFVDALNERVGKCDAMLAVIGRHWLDMQDENGERRLDDPQDFVRIELEAALARKIPVVPILVEGGQVPRADRLPEAIRKLSRQQAYELRHEHFRSDAARLAQAMGDVLAKASAFRDTQFAADSSAVPPAKREILPAKQAKAPALFGSDKTLTFHEKQRKLAADAIEDALRDLTDLQATLSPELISPSCMCGMWPSASNSSKVQPASCRSLDV